MKKYLLFVAMSVLVLSAVGCGTWRPGLCARHRAMAAPMYGQIQYAPACQPVCCQPTCDPCCSGTPMSVGYDGGAMMVPEGEVGCACGQ